MTRCAGHSPAGKFPSDIPPGNPNPDTKLISLASLLRLRSRIQGVKCPDALRWLIEKSDGVGVMRQNLINLQTVTHPSTISTGAGLLQQRAPPSQFMKPPQIRSALHFTTLRAPLPLLLSCTEE